MLQMANGLRSGNTGKTGMLGWKSTNLTQCGEAAKEF